MRYTCSLPAEVVELLRYTADHRGVPASRLVVDALRQHLGLAEPEASADEARLINLERTVNDLSQWDHEATERRLSRLEEMANL